MTSHWLPLVVAAVSTVLTGALYRYAIAYRVLDIPNARSAHTTPTPRGGGIAIVLSFLGAVVFLAARRQLDVRSTVALVGAGSLVALVGFLDDHRPVPVQWRLVAHVIAVAWGLAWLGGVAPIELAGSSLDLGMFGELIGIVALVWLLNLYNFMDGIDGIAALEAGTVGICAAALAWTRSGGADAVLPALLAASSLGFLAWNWPPARIFMGDAGSGFVGLTAGLLAVRAGHSAPALVWAWMILLGVFVVDASITLLRRVHRRESVHQAHSDHAYQHAARRGAHRTVTLAVGLINLLWLMPVAAFVTTGRLAGIAGLAIAYVPLVWLAIRYRSGHVVPLAAASRQETK